MCTLTRAFKPALLFVICAFLEGKLDVAVHNVSLTRGVVMSCLPQQFHGHIQSTDVLAGGIDPPRSVMSSCVEDDWVETELTSSRFTATSC